MPEYNKNDNMVSVITPAYFFHDKEWQKNSKIKTYEISKKYEKYEIISINDEFKTNIIDNKLPYLEFQQNIKPTYHTYMSDTIIIPPVKKTQDKYSFKKV